MILRVLRRRGTRMVRHHAQQHSHWKAGQIDGPPAAVSDNAMLLIGFSDDEVVDRLSSQVAHDTVALIYPLLRGAAIARCRSDIPPCCDRR